MGTRKYNAYEIYDRIAEQVNTLIMQLKQGEDEDTIKIAKEEAYKILTTHQANLQREYDSLKKNSEWKRFTIAFYGETNAGKSTIIELLRIMLNEKNKVKSTKKFKKIQSKHNITQEAFDDIRKIIIESEDVVTELNKKKDGLIEIHSKEIDERNITIAEWAEKYELEKQNRSLWDKFIYLFKSSQTEIQLKAYKNEVKKINKEFNNNIKEIDSEVGAYNKKIKNSRKEEKRLNEESSLLEPYRDGNIIGVGLSDFTKTNSTYSFAYNGVEFDLIDVPGIEGNESIVSESIMQAVQKAHAVFFVTRKPAAPQSGDGKDGILEKIKCQLGAQTEVWTIFNQSITNPNRMQRALIDDDEKGSIANMHQVIEDKLGNEHYRGEIIMSAYPSFLAVANCLIPGTKDKHNQLKFLAKYSPVDILKYTGVEDFINMLPNDIVRNWESKIIRSNFNKAIVALNGTISTIYDLQKNHFEPIEKSLKQNTVDSVNALDNGVERARAGIDGKIAILTKSFSNQVREEIYERINENISNDSFEYNLRSILEKKRDEVIGKFKSDVNGELITFQSDIDNIMERAKKNMNVILEYTTSVPGVDSLNLKVDIDNGLNVWGIIGTIGSAIGIAVAGGPVGIVLGVISLISSVWSAVRSFFSSSYKREQQRKAADENIRAITRKLDSAMRKSLDDFYPQLEVQLDEIKDQLDKPAIVVRNINDSLENSALKLKQIVRSIEGEI